MEMATQLRMAIVEAEQNGTPETRDSLMNSIAQRAFVAETIVRTGGAPAMGGGGKSRAQNTIDRRASGVTPHPVDLALRASFAQEEPVRLAQEGRGPSQGSTEAGRAATAAVAAFSPTAEPSEPQAVSTVTGVGHESVWRGANVLYHGPDHEGEWSIK